MTGSAIMERHCCQFHAFPVLQRDNYDELLWNTIPLWMQCASVWVSAWFSILLGLLNGSVNLSLSFHFHVICVKCFHFIVVSVFLYSSPSFTFFEALSIFFCSQLHLIPVSSSVTVLETSTLTLHWLRKKGLGSKFPFELAHFLSLSKCHVRESWYS